tara:strand:- start:598 stop:5043 length:4446 start_codon:yes stop_codon:yes gene_type:complete
MSQPNVIPQPTQNSLYLQSSRADSIEYITGGDSVGLAAVWTNTFNEAISVNPGDKLTISAASLNAVGNEGGTIEFNGQATSRSKRKATKLVYDNKASIETELYKSADGQYYDFCPPTLTTHSPPGELYTVGTNMTATPNSTASTRTSRYNPYQHDGTKYTLCEWDVAPRTYTGFLNTAAAATPPLSAEQDQQYMPNMLSNDGGFYTGIITDGTTNVYQSALTKALVAAGATQSGMDGAFSLTKNFKTVKNYVSLDIPVGYENPSAIAGYLTQQLNKTEDIQQLNPDLTSTGFSWAKTRHQDVISVSLDSATFKRVPAVPMIDVYNARRDNMLVNQNNLSAANQIIAMSFSNSQIFGKYEISTTKETTYSDQCFNNRSLDIVNTQTIDGAGDSSEHIVWLPYASDAEVQGTKNLYAVLYKYGQTSVGRQTNQFNENAPNGVEGIFGFWNNDDVIDGINEIDSTGTSYLSGGGNSGMGGHNAQRGFCGQVLAGERIYNTQPYAVEPNCYLVQPNTFFDDDNTENPYDYMKQVLLANPELIKKGQSLFNKIYYGNNTEASSAAGFSAVRTGTTVGGMMEQHPALGATLLTKAAYDALLPTDIIQKTGSYGWEEQAYISAGDFGTTSNSIISSPVGLNGVAADTLTTAVVADMINPTQEGKGRVRGFTGTDLDTNGNGQDCYMLTNMSWEDFTNFFKQEMIDYFQAQENATTGYMRPTPYSKTDKVITFDNPNKTPNRMLLHIDRPADQDSVDITNDFLGFDNANSFVEGTYTTMAGENGRGAVAEPAAALYHNTELTYQYISYDYSAKDKDRTSEMNSQGNGLDKILLDAQGIPIPTHGFIYKGFFGGSAYVAFKLSGEDPVMDGYMTSTDLRLGHTTIKIDNTNRGLNIGYSPSFKGVFNMGMTLNNGCPTWSQKDLTISDSINTTKQLINSSQGQMPPLPYLREGQNIGFIMLGANNPKVIYDDTENKFSFQDLHTPQMMGDAFDAGDVKVDTSKPTNAGGSVKAYQNPNEIIFKGTATDGATVGSRQDGMGANNYCGTPYNENGDLAPSDQAGTAFYSLQLVPQENNFGLNFDCAPCVAKRTLMGYIQDNMSGVFFTDFGTSTGSSFLTIPKDTFEGSLWDKLGFTHGELHPISGNRNTRPRDLRNNNQFFTSNPLTTGAEILGSDMIKYNTGRFNLPLYCLGLPRLADAGGTLSYGNLPVGAYPANFSMGAPKIIATSTSLVAFNFPNKSDNPFFLVCCDIIGGQSNYVAGRSGSRMNVAGTVQKYYSGTDYFYGVDAGTGITFTNPSTFSSIKTVIRNPSGQITSSLSGRSSIIYRIDRITPQPIQAPPADTGGGVGGIRGNINPLLDIVRAQTEALQGIAPQDPLNEAEEDGVGVEMGTQIEIADEVELGAVAGQTIPNIQENTEAQLAQEAKKEEEIARQVALRRLKVMKPAARGGGGLRPGAPPPINPVQLSEEEAKDIANISSGITGEEGEEEDS